MICRHTNTRRLLSLIERNRPAISTSPPPTICNLFHLSQYKPWPISFTYFAQIWKAKKKEEMLCLFLFAFFMTFFKRFPELSLSLSKWFFQAEQQYFCIIFFYSRCQPINQSVKWWPGKLANWIGSDIYLSDELIWRIAHTNRTTWSVRPLSHKICTNMKTNIFGVLRILQVDFPLFFSS